MAGRCRRTRSKDGLLPSAKPPRLPGFGTASLSHSLPMNSNPYGGSVTTASTLLSGNCRMTSRQSPSYNVHSDMEPLLIHDPSVLTVRRNRAGVLAVAVQTVPTRIAEIAALGVGFVFPKEPKTRLVVMLSSHGNQPFAYPGHRKT